MKLPLEGIRVLELTHVWSGPMCGQVLADLGAEVIRIESRAHLDIHRRGGPWHGGVAHPDYSGTWNAQNRNKLGCTLDVKQDEGRQLLLDLAAASDVLIENFTPGTLQRLGLGFERLQEANPRIVLLSLSGYGQTGPLRDSLAYGPMMDAATGLSAAARYADGIPRAANGWAADVGGALYGCAAVVRALGQQPCRALHIDISQFEAGVLFVAGPLMQVLNPDAAARPEAGLRLCAECADSDSWVAASAVTLAEVTALLDLLAGREGASALMRTLRREGPAACEAALHEPYARWAAQRSAGQALRELHAAGIPAVPVSRLHELLQDEGLAARRALREVAHPAVGPARNYGPAIRLADAGGQAPDYPRAAPELGGDNARVYGGLLGLSDARIAELAARRVI